MDDLKWWLQHGDSAEVLKLLPSGSVDALVTDPPAGISFMGREWDGHKGGRDKWIAWLAGILVECRRVMKPGAYGWVWALPRTSHWTATACEDAGFAVRDVLVHCFGTGFPKSRALLKPAAEHWILIKAPGELRELRIEENRIGTSKQVPASAPLAINQKYGARPASAADESTAGYDANTGRWPANFALSHSDGCELAGTRKVKGDQRPPQNGSRDGGFADVGADKGDGKPCGPLYGNEEVEAWRCVDGCPMKMLDKQAGPLKSGAISHKKGDTFKGEWRAGEQRTDPAVRAKDQNIPASSGNASRFFYVAKPSTKERSAGLPEGARNTHTTVKSIALMRHLINLIAASGATVLDPFAGSGSTGVAALANGCRFVGIEREAEYAEIAMRRLSHAAENNA